MGWPDEFAPWERLALALSVVAVQTGLALPDAFQVLQDRAKIEGFALAEIALGVLEGSIRFDET